MNVVIPLGGKGERFARHGYTVPKPLINALTKPILRWVVDSLGLCVDDVLCIVYNSSLRPYDIEKLIRSWVPGVTVKILCLEKQTSGAAESVRIACEMLIDNNNPVVCVDGDTFYTCDVIRKVAGKNAVVCFEDKTTYTDPPYSYVVETEYKCLKDIVEKKKVSDAACCGVYAFSHKGVVLNAYKEFEQSMENSAEKYTSKLVQHLVKSGIEFNVMTVDSQHVHNLGTPLHLQVFCNSYPMRPLHDGQRIQKCRVCFDLDNTLVTDPVVCGDYSTVNPIQRNIDVCNHLRRLGHTVIIHTARRMKTHSGSVGKVVADVGRVTIDTLERFGIGYDELYFGKPYADWYIDDKAVNAAENLEKALGCYTGVSPRHFNSCEVSTYSTVVKRSIESLAGEIYWYENIPMSIKDMFPVYFGSNGENEYTIEHIQGVSLSKQLVTSPMVVLDLLHEVFKSIDRIHSCVYDTCGVDVKGLYMEKVKIRFETNASVYSKIPNALQIYERLMSYFEKNAIYKLCVMHGDPVFSNIIVNSFGKFKFIDMRGCIDNVCTIVGDAYYDYGKLYQSILGYDFVLNNVEIDASFVEQATLILQRHIGSEELFTHIQMVTASLVFSMLPLHDNLEKRMKYMRLIENIL